MAAGSSETDCSLSAVACSVDCSSIGGLLLRMKKAKITAAMLISAATLKAVGMPPFRAGICGSPAWLKAAVRRP